MTAVTRDDLFGRWTHSHEEDTPETRVYRRSTYAFPRSRGRASFELESDGSLVEEAPGRGDRPEAQSGRWELHSGKLVLRPGSPSERVLDVISAEPDRLVVKR